MKYVRTYITLRGKTKSHEPFLPRAKVFAYFFFKKKKKLNDHVLASVLLMVRYGEGIIADVYYSKSV